MSMTFRKSWQWTRQEASLYARYLTGSSLHVCAGTANLGDVKLDLYQPFVDVKADAMKLPFRDRSITTILCDPPWLHGVELKILKELRRVAKKRIIFITMNDIRFPRSSPWKLIALWHISRNGGNQHNIKACYVFEREANQSLEDYQ